MVVAVRSLPDKVAKTITRYSMVPAGARLGVAVSGGGDSVALLHLLREVLPANPLTVLHFNHWLRGDASDKDAQFAEQLAHSLDLPFHAACWDERPGANVEGAARKARLEFFARARQVRGLDRIATGHTRDDQAETVLLRILRGSGVTGLAGILPVTEAGLVRPLIEVSRAGIRAWLTEQGLAWREDLTNEDPLHAARNRIRLELLPKLRSEWNPRIDDALAHMARIAADEEAYWREETVRLLPPDLVFSVPQMRAWPVAVQRRLLRAAVARVKGDLRRVRFDQVEAALQLIERHSGDGQASWPGGVIVERSFDWLQVRRKQPPREPHGVTWREMPAPSVYNRNRSYLDWKSGSDAPVLRAWRPGDRYWPLGDTKERTLKELFQRGKTASWERLSWPILEGSGKILWSRQFGPAAACAATSTSRTVLEVVDELDEANPAVVTSNTK